MRILILALFVVCWCASAAAQRCTLKAGDVAKAPELLGFHLGMTFDEVKTRVPQVQFDEADKIGLSKTSINPSYDSRFDQASFPDVRTISLDFLDGKLTTLWIGYESSFKWATLDEFTEGITGSWKLSATWSPKRNGRQIGCDGFTVFVSMIAGGPSVRLTDDAADELIATRREEAAAAELVVIGDSKTKLYYSADCSALGMVAPQNRISFKDKDEAEKAGYKLAKACE